ncbi:MAG: type IX secretion system sortase PorU, partial [Bacteroidota bacterium]
FGNDVDGVLPQSNAIERPFDLQEIPILVNGEEDGSFDQGDYVLFYAKGPDKQFWSASGIEYQKNFYSDTAYYFLTVSSDAGKRIQLDPANSLNNSTQITEFDDAIFIEQDLNNVLTSGRIWLGELLSDRDEVRNNVVIENVSSDIELTLSAVNRSPEEASFRITANDSQIGDLEIREVASGASALYAIKAFQEDGAFIVPQNENLDITVLYEGNSSNAIGYVDYIQLNFKKSLSMTSENFVDFRSLDALNQASTYTISNASANVSVWDVTDLNAISEMELSTAQGSITFSHEESDHVREFIAFQGSDFDSPFYAGRVSNQNIKGLTNRDGIIITSGDFSSAAQELANFHIAHSQLDVAVVTTRQIYNEFSSGRQDISAIRDFLKYLKDEGGKLRYVTLFGDCSVDFKDRISNNTNFVPTYASRNSYDPIFSYSSDDYFTFLEDDEGEWFETRSGDHTMDIGIGRLPVKSLEEAEQIVDKIIYYSTDPRTLGRWRHEISYLSDDADGNIHMRHAEDLSKLIDTTYVQYGINKIFLDAFEQISGTTGNASPQTTNAFKRQIKNGTFSMNYIGHGNERQLTGERILTNDMISSFTNLNKLPIFITATCEFGRYDDPREISGSERLLLSSTGGAIALLTTSRPVFASTNFSLNEAFHRNIFQRVDGEFQRLGDIIRLTKNEGLEGAVNRNFTLLGDPMLLPAFPKLDVVLDAGTSILDTLSALEEVFVQGTIQDDGIIREDFNGELFVEILDVEQTFVTKGQESDPFTFSRRSNAVFRGETEVTNGAFSFSFVVPKNISYQFENGKMSLYAMDSDLNLDAAGAFKSFKIGGTANTTPVDTAPPSIQMFLNDDNFRNGGTVGSSSLFIAHLEDESGITTASSGIVEGVSMILDDEFFNLNEFYTANPDGYQSGQVIFPIQDLEPGRHTISLTVWDTHNNQAQQEIEFFVTDEPTIFLSNVAVYPNPIVNDAIFEFNHDRGEEDLLIKLLIYNGQGVIVNDIDYEFRNSPDQISIPYQPISTGGRVLPKGIYYYRMVIRSNFDGAIKELTNRLVIDN